MGENRMKNHLKNSQNFFPFFSHFGKKVGIFLSTYHIDNKWFKGVFDKSGNGKKVGIFLPTYHIVFICGYEIFEIPTFSYIIYIFFLKKMGISKGLKKAKSERKKNENRRNENLRENY